MSTPPKPKAAAASKPKRPLSGYNLFYRYKRNLVVEVTSRPNHDNEAIVRSVLATPPGLEGVPPASPLLRLPPARLNQFRVAAIRNAMEGKLFPNENARSRVHCKVHGMGFVEMGRMMRQTWGRADELTKDVFNELADVGRVRYRRLAAEYKLSSEHPTNVHSKLGDPVESSVVDMTSQTQISNGSGEAAVAAKSTASRVGPTKNPPVAAATTFQTSIEPEPKKDKCPRPSYGRRVSSDLDFQGPVPCQARSFGRSRGDLFEPLSFDATTNTGPYTKEAYTKEKPSYGRRVSTTATEIDLCGGSLFHPLPVEAGDASATPKISHQPKWGRRVSTGHCPPPLSRNGMGGTITSNNTANSGSDANLEGLRTRLEMKQIQLRNAIEKIQRQMAENNSLLPPEMQVHPQENVPGEKARVDIMARSGSPIPDSVVVGGDKPGVGEEAKELRVSERDFMDFIGELDDAIDPDADDIHSIDMSTVSDEAEARERAGASGAFVFGKPVFGVPGNFGDKPASPSQVSVAIPAAIELKTNRARMA